VVNGQWSIAVGSSRWLESAKAFRERCGKHRENPVPRPREGCDGAPISLTPTNLAHQRFQGACVSEHGHRPRPLEWIPRSWIPGSPMRPERLECRPALQSNSASVQFGPNA